MERGWVNGTFENMKAKCRLIENIIPETKPLGQIEIGLLPFLAPDHQSSFLLPLRAEIGRWREQDSFCLCHLFVEIKAFAFFFLSYSSNSPVTTLRHMLFSTHGSNWDLGPIAHLKI